MKKQYALAKAVAEAKNFIEQAEELLSQADAEMYWHNTNSRKRGEVGRKSMDLTRALADYRQAKG